MCTEIPLKHKDIMATSVYLQTRCRSNGM